jgi:hypothetical protein
MRDARAQRHSLRLKWRTVARSGPSKNGGRLPSGCGCMPKRHGIDAALAEGADCIGPRGGKDPLLPDGQN